MKRRALFPSPTAILILAVFPAAPVAAQASARGVGQDSAGARADSFPLQAASVRSRGSVDTARTPAESALELAPGDSEALFLRAQTELPDRDMTAACVAYRGDRIEGVTRGGTSLPVVVDVSRGVTWIGKPAPAVSRPDATTTDGLQVIGGIEYAVFRHGRALYVEATR